MAGNPSGDARRCIPLCTPLCRAQHPMDAREEEEPRGASRKSPLTEALLATYNTRQLLNLTNNVPGTIKIDSLPLARVKRIMKQDACYPQPRMISADTVPLMAYAAQLLIGSHSAVAWQTSTVPSGRNTLQVSDLKAVIKSNDRYDFLVDVLDIFDHNQAVAAESGESSSHPADPDPGPMPMPTPHAMTHAMTHMTTHSTTHSMSHSMSHSLAQSMPQSMPPPQSAPMAGVPIGLPIASSQPMAQAQSVKRKASSPMQAQPKQMPVQPMQMSGVLPMQIPGQPMQMPCQPMQMPSQSMQMNFSQPMQMGGSHQMQMGGSHQMQMGGSHSQTMQMMQSMQPMMQSMMQPMTQQMAPIPPSHMNMSHHVQVQQGMSYSMSSQMAPMMPAMMPHPAQPTRDDLMVDRGPDEDEDEEGLEFADYGDDLLDVIEQQLDFDSLIDVPGLQFDWN